MSPGLLEEPTSQPDDGYPAHWPATKLRLLNADEHLHELNEMVDEEHWKQRLMGFCAQQAFEIALKGWVSAIDDGRNWDHDPDRLWGGIHGKEEWGDPELGRVRELVEELLEHVRYEDPQCPGGMGNWLTNYGAVYRYNGTSHRMTQTERLGLRERIDAAVYAIVGRIHALSGTSESDLYPEGSKPCELATE